MSLGIPRDVSLLLNLIKIDSTNCSLLKPPQFFRARFLCRERAFRTRSYLGPGVEGYPDKFPIFVRRRLQGSPGGAKMGAKSLDFTKKMDPSRSPVGADRSEIKSDRERCAVRPFLVPRGPKISQKRSNNLNLPQNPGGCRPENPSLYPPLRGALLVAVKEIGSDGGRLKVSWWVRHV